VFLVSGAGDFEMILGFLGFTFRLTGGRSFDIGELFSVIVEKMPSFVKRLVRPLNL